MFNYGIEDGKFFIDFQSISRPVGNFKEENTRRAVEILEKYKGRNIVIGFTGGVDSQAMRYSFKQVGVDIDCVFLHMPGFNEEDFNQVKICDEKYGKKTEVITLNPLDCRDEIIHLAETHGFANRFIFFQQKFYKMLPDNTTLVQSILDPFVYVRPESQNQYFVQDYESIEICRHRCFSLVKDRDLQFDLWGETPEMLYATINDDVYKGGINSAFYFDSTGYIPPARRNYRTIDRYDAFIKPILYGRYYTPNELFYFGKRGGMETVDYFYEAPSTPVQEHYIAIPYHEFLNFLGNQDGRIQRWYENISVSQAIASYKQSTAYLKR